MSLRHNTLPIRVRGSFVARATVSYNVLPLLSALAVLLTLACTDAAHSTVGARVAALPPAAALTATSLPVSTAAAPATQTSVRVMVPSLAPVRNTRFYRTTVGQPIYAVPTEDQSISVALDGPPIGTLHADVVVDVVDELSTKQAVVAYVPLPSVASNGAFRLHPLADIYGWTKVVLAKRVPDTQQEEVAMAPAHYKRFTEIFLAPDAQPFALIDCHPVRQLERVGKWQKVIASFPVGELFGWVMDGQTESTACFERALPDRDSARAVPDMHLPVREVEAIDARLIEMSSTRATVFELSKDNPDCREFRFMPTSSDGGTGHLVSGNHKMDYRIGGSLLLHYVCSRGVKPRLIMSCERTRSVVGFSDSSLSWLWLYTADVVGDSNRTNPIIGYHPDRTHTWFLNRQQCEQAALTKHYTD